jgi:D-ribose pyranose/furanose isomerase RbsD
MNLLSIDVGIKNLALCLIHLDNENNFDIIKWDVINLCKEEKQKCDCGKNAAYVFDNIYYCKKHSIKCNKPILCKELEDNKLKKIKIKDLKELLSKENIPFQTEKSKPVLIDYLKTYLPCHYVIPFNNTIKTNDLSLIDIGINMKELLDELYNNIKIDRVIIENQISPIANRMKTLQGMIAQYFIMNNILNIEFISATNKLKDFNTNKKTTYSERKKKGIEICEELLVNNESLNKYLEMFVESKKKDDLADCFLQGLWYLKENFKIIYN